MASIWDFFGAEAGQRRTAALNRLESDLAYYIPPELRQLVGLLADSTPTASMGRAGAAATILLAPDRTGMERFGDFGEMLSETAGMAAPLMVAKRAAIPAAEAIQEALLGVSVPAREAGRNISDLASRIEVDPNTLGSTGGNIRLRPQTDAPFDEVEAAMKAEAPQISISETIKSKYPDVKIDLFGNPEKGYELSRIVVPKEGRSSGVGTQVMEDIIQMADAQGAKVSLTPDTEFGGTSVSRLKDFYKRFGFVENKGRNKDFSTRNTMYRNPQSKAPEKLTPTPAQNISGLLSTGRANEVTDEMLGLLTPNDTMELVDLYRRGATGMDLPMDEASRMARAGEMGFDTGTPLYHGTGSDFQAFDSARFGQSDHGSKGRGVYASQNPDVANGYATLVDEPDRQVYPLIYGLRNAYDGEIPMAMYDEGTSIAFTNNLKNLGFDGVMRPNARKGGEITEAVAFDPTDIRSRFARFDPRLAHLRNLSAGVGGLGLLSTMMPQEEQY